jgi:hypothetical protein
MNRIFVYVTRTVDTAIIISFCIGECLVIKRRIVHFPRPIRGVPL